MNKQKTETDPEIQRILYGLKGRGWQTTWVKANGRFRIPVIVSHRDTNTA